jgi:hypothetical protein
MNTTQAYVYIKKEWPQRLVIVWERGDIEDMRDEIGYIFVGTCQYDTETNTIIEWEGR